MKRKLLAVLVAVSLVLIWQSEGYGVNPRCNPTIQKCSRRSSIPIMQYYPHSKVKRAVIRDSSSLICGDNALCGTLTGTFEIVYGHVGILYYDTDLEKTLFVPIYAMKAVQDSSQYKIPKWDGKVFWMRISSDPAVPPRVLQPQFTDDNGDGTRTVTVNVSYYIQKDKDYSLYAIGSTICQLYLTVNADNRVIDYTMDVYDQDGNLSEEGVKLGIGDQIDTINWSEHEDAPGWQASMALEEFTTVAKDPEFIYAGYIPGREIPCTGCEGKIVLADADLYFRLEGWNFTTSTEPVWSEKQPLGRLKDNVDTCSQYPFQTLANPTLADVVEGMKIVASLAPQHFCFRDVNNDGRFDMADVIWMIQKIALLR